MDAMIFKEIMQLLEIGLEADNKDEKHTCLYNIAHNFNLLVGSPVLNLGERKQNLKNITTSNLLRAEMKNLLFRFNQAIIRQADQSVINTQEKIKLELGSIATAFATEYAEIQQRYADLLFQQDLEEIVGKDNAQLFANFKMFRNAANN